MCMQYVFEGCSVVEVWRQCPTGTDSNRQHRINCIYNLYWREYDAPVVCHWGLGVHEVCFVCLFCCFTSQVNSYGHDGQFT